MTILKMLQQSAILTVLGMAIVFAFLWVMIVCISWVGKLVHRMGWDKDVQPSKDQTPKNIKGTVTPEITAAISAGVAEYQKRTGAS